MLTKIRLLHPSQKDEVVATVDRMLDDNRKQKNEAFITAVAELSDESLSRIWDNPRDAEYDDL